MIRKTCLQPFSSNKPKTSFRSFSSFYSNDSYSWLTFSNSGSATLVGAVVFGCYYLNKQHKRLNALPNEIKRWQAKSKEEIFSDAKPFVDLTAKLRLLSNYTAKEMEKLTTLQERIETSVLVGNELQRELRSFSCLEWLSENITLFDARPPWGDIVNANKCKVDEHQIFLVYLRQLIYYHEHARKHEYGAANYYMKELLKQLKWELGCDEKDIMDSDRDTAKRFSSLFDIEPEKLQVRLYNFTAKSVRNMGELTNCEKYYEKALKLDPKNPYLHQGLLALKGDFAWKEKNPFKIKHLLNKKIRNDYEIFFCDAGHGLGLADLSWGLIRLVGDKENSFNLSSNQKIELLEEAIKLACLAMPLINKSKKKEQSVNAYTYYAIAQLKLYDFSPNNEIVDLHEALAKLDEGLKKDKCHPALLRRRFMVLDKLQNEERLEALLVAYAELNYRIAYENDNDSKLYGWLKELLCDAQHLSFTLGQKQVLDELREGGYPKPDDVSLQSYRKWYKRRFEENGLPKSRSDFLNLLNLKDCVTPYIAASLSMVAYDAKYKGNYVAPEHWEEKLTSLDVGTNWSKESGYLGAAYQNSITGQWIIAHGGTDTNEAQDFVTDFRLAIKLKDSRIPQLQHAKAFTKAVIEKIKKEKEKLKPFLGEEKNNLRIPLESTNFIVYHTGHSLGGFIASYLVCSQKEDIEQRAITFDCPSSFHQIKKKWRQGYSFEQLPVTNYLARPNFINGTTGKHPGCSYHIPLGLDNPAEIAPPANKLWRILLSGVLLAINAPSVLKLVIKNSDIAISILSRNIHAHNLDKIFEAFKQDSKAIFYQREKIRLIQKWITTPYEWYIFESELNSKGALVCDPSLVDMPSKIKDNFAELNLLKTKPDLKFKDGQIHPVEIVEMKHLEPRLQNLIKSYSNTLDLTDCEKKEMKEVQGFVNTAIPKFFNYDEENELLEVSYPFSSWEILLYLRQQIELASHILKPQSIIQPSLNKDRPSSSSNPNRHFSTYYKYNKHESFSGEYSNKSKNRN